MNSTDTSSKCPFSCPIVKKICCILGLIGFIAAIYFWCTARNEPANEFIAHRERLAIFLLLLSHIICGLGKPKCCATGSCDTTQVCETK
jgi:hypothetical protein